MSAARTKLSERTTNILESIMTATVASLLVGLPTTVKLRGTQIELEAVTCAVKACRQFQDALERPNASITEVMERLSEKRKAVKEFERVLNVAWPL